MDDIILPRASYYLISLLNNKILCISYILILSLLKYIFNYELILL